MGSFSSKRVRRSEAPTDEKCKTIRVWLLGGFRVSVGSRTITQEAWRLRKAAALVKLLALAPGHRLHREQIMDLLWPDSGRRAASNNLRNTLHTARRTLDSDAGSHCLASEDESLVLCPEGDLWVDVEAFEEAAAIAWRAKEPAAYRAALGLYSSELLPGDRYEGWAEEPRRRLRETYLSLLLSLARLHEELGDYESAVEAFRRSVAEEPTREETHVGLMRLYALLDSKEEALAQYGRLEEALSTELDIEPSASSRTLREEIVANRFPPKEAYLYGSSPEELSSAGKHNLPAPRTSFVGREREMLGVKRALAMTRLLTLTGVGGSGKTRLALEVARDLVGSYPDGVWLVELAPLSEGELVAQEAAGVLGVQEQPGRTLLDSLLDNLGNKEMLLILDNCEHLIDAVVRLTMALLDSCPDVRLLATSRERLGVMGELTWLVPSLSVPGAEKTPTVEELEGYESARLFADRASKRHPGFELTPENARAVAQICARLEGIPLAIELATARVGLLSAEQISDRLGNAPKLLTGGERTADRRHQTLRMTLDWSYELLGGLEQALFSRLAAFAGSFTLEAAESVVGTGGSIDAGDVLELLPMLADKSLVVVEESWERGARYRLLEPIRQYAREKLSVSGEGEAIGHRHAEFFLALTEEAEPELRGPGQVKWLARLEEDNDNLRVAIGWLLEKGEIEATVRMAWNLWIFWLIHGHQSEGRHWIEAALAKGENLTAQARARALWVQASTYYGLGDPELIERNCRESAALFWRAGDKVGLGHALSGQASVRMQRGDTEQAITLFEESIELGRETGERWGVSGALAHLGSVYLGLGDHEQAVRFLEEGLALSREIGNRLSISTALYGLALAERSRGAQARAAELYAEGLAASIEAGDNANTAYCLEGLAQVAVAQGNMEHAARLFGAAEASLEAASGALYSHAQDRSLREQAMNAIRSRLDETTLTAAWVKGGAMSPAETLEYVLSAGERASKSAPTVPEEASAGPTSGNLTRREWEVADLVAHGLTNRQIASALSISEHTVANHVAKVLRKLGLDSRSQLTAWVVERRTPT